MQGANQASLFFSSQSMGSHSSTLLPSGSMIQANFPFSWDSGPLTISTIGAGDVLGVSWMLPPDRWTFDGVAAVPTTAIQFDATCLRGKCDADPRLGYALYTALAGIVRDRLVAARLQLMDLYGDADHR